MFPSGPNQFGQDLLQFIMTENAQFGDGGSGGAIHGT